MRRSCLRRARCCPCNATCVKPRTRRVPLSFPRLPCSKRTTHMARKRKDKDAPAEVAGTITPGDDAPPVDVQVADDANASGPYAEADAPEPIGTTGEDDNAPAPVEDMPPVEVTDVDGESAAPVAGTDGLASLEADMSLPAVPEKRGRYDTPEKKAERNRKEREKREAKAAERAGKVARATGVATKAAAKSAKVADVPAPASMAITSESGVDLSVLLGLSFHAISMALPEKYGGGPLTVAERDLLGKAWAGPLAPYLSGAAGPWAVAAISTVQVFAVRAMMYQPPKAAPAPVHSRQDGAGSAPAAPVAPVEPPAAPVAPAGKVTQQEPGVGGD